MYKYLYRAYYQRNNSTFHTIHLDGELANKLAKYKGGWVTAILDKNLSKREAMNMLRSDAIDVERFKLFF